MIIENKNVFMKEKIIFSIIIPIYNVGDYLDRTLQSVKRQSFESWECILVDDGSTDNSAKICKFYEKSDSRFQYILQENGGVSSARNRGLSKAVGKWILFLDGDDILLPDACASFYEVIKNVNTNVIIGNFETEDLNGNVSQTEIREKKYLIQPLKNLWYREFYSRPGNTLIKRSVFKYIQGYDEELSYNEDYEFTLRLLSVFSVYLFPAVVMRYFKVEGGASNHIHPYNKDFVSKISLLSENSVWVKYLHFSILKFAVKNRLCRNKDIEPQLINDFYSYPFLFKIKYFGALICRRIKKIL